MEDKLLDQMSVDFDEDLGTTILAFVKCVGELPPPNVLLEATNDFEASEEGLWYLSLPGYYLFRRGYRGEGNLWDDARFRRYLLAMEEICAGELETAYRTLYAGYDPHDSALCPADRIFLAELAFPPLAYVDWPTAAKELARLKAVGEKLRERGL